MGRWGGFSRLIDVPVNGGASISKIVNCNVRTLCSWESWYWEWMAYSSYATTLIFVGSANDDIRSFYSTHFLRLDCACFCEFAFLWTLLWTQPERLNLSRNVSYLRNIIGITMLWVCMRLWEICRCKPALDTSNDYVGKERYTVGNSNGAVNSIKILLKMKVDSSGDNNRICRVYYIRI